MSEARLWEYVRLGMGGRWAAQRHEDKYSLGIPDVSYSAGVHGWIELKFVAKPPNNPKSNLIIRHFTATQRNWLTTHGSRGGRCYLLVQVEKTYLLFTWDQVAMVGACTFQELKENAFRCWEGRIPWVELLKAIGL